MRAHHILRFVSGPCLRRPTAAGKAILAGLLFQSVAALAHKPSDSYLTLGFTENRIEARWDLALRDLEAAVGLDLNNNGQISWGELRARQSKVVSYALSRLELRSAGQLIRPRFEDLLVDHHSDGAYAVLQFAYDGLSPGRDLEVGYQALFDLDPQHRGIMRIGRDEPFHLAIFSPDRRTHRVDPDQRPRAPGFVAFLWEGVWHIWIGFDHLLFLFTLLLPAVLRPAHRGRELAAAPPNRGPFATPLGRTLLDVIKIVTAFTVAHSLTLGLAFLDVVRLPARWVEASIAASVLVAASANVFGRETRLGVKVAFGFGLIHGFGFAGVMSALATPGSGMVWALAGFNLGVELGQMAVVAAVFPMLYGMRDRRTCEVFALRFASAAIALLAGTWMIERAFDLKLAPF